MGTSSKKSCKTATVMNLISRRPEGANPALGAVPESDTVGQREQIEYIDIDRIDDDPRNFYELSGLDELAANIELLGLQQPIRVRPGEEPGRYVIVSGHRRRAAIAKLVEGGREDCRLIPCIVERNQESAALQELRLIYANSDTRRMTAADISRQAERVEALLYQLKEEGYEFPGRMRDQVAAACRVSAPKLARLKVIREKLKAPEFLLLFEKDRLPEQAAYALARLPEDFQRRLAGISTEFSAGVAERVLAKYKEGWRWEPDMQCPDGKACRRGDAFLRHDLERPYEMCGGITCCLECSRAKESYSPCDRMCSKAQALRKEKREEKKAAEDARALERTRQYQRETRANARRVLRAIEAAGLANKTHIPWGSMDRLYAGLIRKYAAGEFPEDKRWYGPELNPSRLEDPAKTARVLGCSADYLLGLTEELTPPTAAAPPPGPEPEPESVPQSAAGPLDRENLNRLYGLLLREEQAGSDAAGALRWAIFTLEQLLNVSKLDTLGEEGDEA